MPQTQSSPPATRGTGGTTAVAHLLSILLLIGLSIATYAYERTLTPLYGFAPTRLHMNKIVWGAAILGTFLPTLSAWTSFFVTGVLLCVMPQAAYWAAVYSGRYGDPVWGPVATHMATLGPFLYFGFSVVKELQKGIDTSSVMGAPTQAITLPTCRMAVMTLQDLWPLIPYLREASERDIFVYIGTIGIVVWILAPFLPKSEASGSAPKPQSQSSGSGNMLRIAMLPLLPYILGSVHSPTLPKPFKQLWTHPSAPLRILSSVTSPYSGVVVVGEILPPTPADIAAGNVNEPHSLRYLRAGHSLLGGVWTGERSYRLDGRGPLGLDANLNPIGDSIYSAFIVQEAARLVETSEKREHETALFIGLGTGIAAQSFIKHNISSTIVEIDPAVYEAATEYFGLVVPQPDRVAIMDARSWVMERSRNVTNTDMGSSEGLFDYVVHDVFSGGGVPSHLFTQPFWRELNKIIKPEGVVAVNVAGKLNSDSLKSIVVTLKSIFPQCRAFHDSMEGHTEEELRAEFINWVFFCTKSSEPITLRPSVEADYLQSFLREKVLSTITQREFDLNVITRDLEEKDLRRLTLTDEHNPLMDWQEAEAVHHWKLMRDVLPPVYWETY